MGHHKKNHKISNARTKKSAERKWRRKEKVRLKVKPKTKKIATQSEDKPSKTRRNKTVVSVYTMLQEES